MLLFCVLTIMRIKGVDVPQVEFPAIMVIFMVGVAVLSVWDVER